jgi:hypothetical protein
LISLVQEPVLIAKSDDEVTAMLNPRVSTPELNLRQTKRG